MSFEELSKQKILSYKTFVEFLEKEYNYPLNEDVAKNLYESYLSSRKRHIKEYDRENISKLIEPILDCLCESAHRFTLIEYSALYIMRVIKNELEDIKRALETQELAKN